MTTIGDLGCQGVDVDEWRKQNRVPLFSAKAAPIASSSGQCSGWSASASRGWARRNAARSWTGSFSACSGFRENFETSSSIQWVETSSDETSAERDETLSRAPDEW